MASLKFTCPECRTTFTSRAGGGTATCPKCNTEFADDGMAGGRDEADARGEAWSYKNSWLRYVVLTVLLVAMGVLGYMLYEKRMGERADTKPIAGESKEGEPPPPPPRKQPDGGKGGGAGGGGGGTAVAPKPPSPVTDPVEIGKRLARVWEYKTPQGTIVLDYMRDGTFVYTPVAPAARVSGKWVIEKVGIRSTGDPAFIVSLKLTAEGKDISPAQVFLKANELEKHPLLHDPKADPVTFDAR